MSPHLFFDSLQSLLATSDGPVGLPPLVESVPVKIAIIALAYFITLLFSGTVIGWAMKAFLRPERQISSQTPANTPKTDSESMPIISRNYRNIGRLIRKCENIITVTFGLIGQETGLALIFAAKSLVRRDDIKENPGFFLGGTLVNLVWAMSIGFIARVLIAGL